MKDMNILNPKTSLLFMMIQRDRKLEDIAKSLQVDKAPVMKDLGDQLDAILYNCDTDKEVLAYFNEPVNEGYASVKDSEGL